MSERGPARSPAAAQASRRNGAVSRGPTSAEGKAASSRNARKHGLFGADAVSGPISPRLAAVLGELGQGGDHSTLWQREIAIMAALRLSRANELARHLQGQLAVGVLDLSVSDGAVSDLIASLLRMQRHARRFRGQRDRALRKVVGAAAASSRDETKRNSSVGIEPG